jgi:hypothetical protein
LAYWFCFQWSNLERFRKVTSERLRASADSFSTSVTFVWGIDIDSPIDRDAADADNENDLGEVQYEDSFAIAEDTDLQSRILHVCSELRGKRDPASSLPFEAQDDWVADGQVRCWLQNFGEYLEQTYNQSLPAKLSEDVFAQRLREFVGSAQGAEYSKDVDSGTFLKCLLVCCAAYMFLQSETEMELCEFCVDASPATTGDCDSRTLRTLE